MRTTLAAASTLALVCLALGSSLAACNKSGPDPNTPSTTCPPGQLCPAATTPCPPGQVCPMVAPCPPGQLCNTAPPVPTATTPVPVASTTAPPASAGGAATPLPALAAAGAAQILAQLAKSEAPGMKADGDAFAAQFQEGQTLEQPINILPSKCYTIVAGGIGPTDVSIQLLLNTIPPLPPIPLAQSTDHVPNPVLAGKKGGGCWRNPTPIGGPGKVILKAVKGQGMIAAQVFIK